MNDADRKSRLNQLISDQAGWMSDLARFQQRLELYRDGKLPADDAKIEKIAQGQAQYLAAARNINDTILGTVKSPEAQAVEIERFLVELDEHDVDLANRAAWRATVLATEDWRRAAAEIARNGTSAMHWKRADITRTDILLALVELLDRHGFTPAERRDVLNNVRMTTSG
jgi:hypothetical protein